MPNLERQINQRLVGSRVFGTFDVKSGYDYLPVDEASKKYFNLLMPWGSAYQLQGAPQGWINSPMFFQQRIVEQIIQPTGLYNENKNGIIQWVDDTR